MKTFTFFLPEQMQQLMQFINAGVSGRAAELDNLWSLLASLNPQTYIVRATGGPRSAVRGRDPWCVVRGMMLVCVSAQACARTCSV